MAPTDALTEAEQLARLEAVLAANELELSKETDAERQARIDAALAVSDEEVEGMRNGPSPV